MSPFDVRTSERVVPREFQSALSKVTTAAPAGDEDEALATARAFEKLLIHDLLKTMRRTTSALGETPSNARANYDDMLDERLAGIMSEGGGLGFAERLAETLRQKPTRTPDRQPGKAESATTIEAPTRAPTPAPTTGIDPNGKGADTSTVATPGVTPVHGTPLDGRVTADVMRLRALLDTPASSTTGREASAAASAAVLHAPSSLAAAMIEPRTPASDVTAEQRAFLNALLPHARRSAHRLGTDPHAVLAIAALESDWGRQVIPAGNGLSSHNLFGIKGRAGAPDVVPHRTREFVNGKPRQELAWFRTYQSPGAAVSGFADFLERNPRYSDALAKAGNPREFLSELQAAGYATDPNYAAKTIKVMERIRALRDSHS